MTEPEISTLLSADVSCWWWDMNSSRSHNDRHRHSHGHLTSSSRASQKMSTRAVLSYDDITEPILPIPSETSVPKSIDGAPTKRPRWAKTNARPAKRARLHHAEAHWDSPTESTSIVSYDPIDSIPPPPPSASNHPLSLGQSKSGPSQQQQKRDAVNGNFKNDQERHLSLGENGVWDDSSLIEAWEAANEEYEVCNQPTIFFFLQSEAGELTILFRTAS